MKGVPHYTKDGTLFSGKTHKMKDGALHSGATHTKASKPLLIFAINRYLYVNSLFLLNL